MCSVNISLLYQLLQHIGLIEDPSNPTFETVCCYTRRSIKDLKSAFDLAVSEKLIIIEVQKNDISQFQYTELGRNILQDVRRLGWENGDICLDGATYSQIWQKLAHKSWLD